MPLDPRDYTSPGFVFHWNRTPPLRKAVRRAANWVRHPLLTRRLRGHVPRTVAGFAPSAVVSRVGVPLEDALRRIRRLAGAPVERMLVVGCGEGAAMGEWLRLRPKEVVALDLYSFEGAWRQVADACRARGYEVRFQQQDIADLRGVLEDCWADVIVSEAVFEHCQELHRVLPELRRVLRDGGILYAGYGPIWHSAGGDHFSGRGGLRHAYNHLLLSDEEYQEYFRAHLREGEAVQDGGRYVPLNLFSRLAPRDYLRLYRENGFTVEDLVVEVSAVALEFRRAYPAEWRRLQELHPDLWEEDFLVKSHWVWLRKGRAG